MPAVYYTVIYCLVNRAHVERGQSLLIHSAAGGVGIAAIHVARWLGLEIYVTTGTDEKVEFLRREFGIPAERIFNSRDSSFVSGLLNVTAGRGVDFVLNSLSGELLHASWKCVAPNGTMIEIGNRDILGQGQLSMFPFHENRTFTCFDLSTIGWQVDTTRRMLKQIMDLYEDGHIHPIRPITTFAAESVEEAYRCFQRGQHIGKLVIKFPSAVDGETPALPLAPSIPAPYFRNNVSYLLVGGTGGLGKAIASWMVSCNARSLIFVSRSAGKSREDQEFFEELEEAGCHVQSYAGDVTSPATLQEVVAKSRFSIAGCMQMAMVLRDIGTMDMDIETWHTAVHPKVAGTWNLHRLLPKDMDFFVLFSSLAGTFGYFGQANYASANTFLDAFTQYRHQNGLAASVIDIGPVDDVGYVATTASTRQTPVGGMNLISEQDFLNVLQLAVAPMQVSAMQRYNSTYHNPTQYAQIPWCTQSITDPLNNAVWKRDPRMAIYRNIEKAMSASSDKGGASDVARRLISSLTAEPDKLNDPASADTLSRAIAMRVNTFLMKSDDSSEELDTSQNLAAVGVDSLVAIELRNWWKQTFGVDVSVLELMNASSIRALGDLSVERLKVRDKFGRLSHKLPSIGTTMAGNRFSDFNRIDLPYAQVNGIDLMATILTPEVILSSTKAPSPSPVLVHWHGGGFIAGHLSQHRVIEFALSHKAVIISPDYRLLPEANGTDILADVQAFSQWVHDELSTILRHHHPDVTLNLDQVLAFGESAGGYLALQSAVLFSNILDIKAVISVSGPLDNRVNAIVPGPRVIMGMRPPSPRQAEALIREYIRKNKPGTVRTEGDSTEMWPLLLSIHQQAWMPRLLGFKRDGRLSLTDSIAAEPCRLPPLLIIHPEHDSMRLILHVTMEFSVTIITLLVLTLLFILDKVDKWWFRRTWGKQYGCGQVKVLPNKLPFGIERFIFRFGFNFDRFNFLEDLVRRPFEEAGCYTYRLDSPFSSSVIYTADPANTKAILNTQINDFEFGPIRGEVARQALGHGILTSEGETWAHYRRQLKPHFAREYISSLEDAEHHLAIFLKTLPPTNEASGWTETDVDVVPTLQRFTLDTATELLFGQSINCQTKALTGEGGVDDVDFSGAMRHLAQFLALRARLDMFAWILPTGKYRQACKDMQSFAARYVNAALDDTAKGSSSGVKDEKKRTALLYALLDDTQDPIELRDQILQLLIGGRNTTATLISNILMFLARSPDQWVRYRAEVLQSFKPGTIPTFEELRACKILTYIMYEALRMLPINPITLGRRAVKNTTLPCGGGPDGSLPIAIRKGESVRLCQYVMFRRHDIWGNDGDEFRPERWQGKKFGPEFVPFSAGPRICIGQQLALNECAFVLSSRPTIVVRIITPTTLVKKMNVLVVGAGPTGLIAAYALARIGHSVTILERHASLQTNGGTIMVQPAASNALFHIGLEDAIRAISVPGHDFAIWSHKCDTEPISIIPYCKSKSGDTADVKTSDVLMTERPSFQSMAYTAAVSVGATVLFAKQVVRLDDCSPRPHVWTSDGVEYGADLIVATDGIKSRMRRLMFPSLSVTAAPLPQVLIQSQVALSTLQADPRCAPFVVPNRVNITLGPGMYSLCRPTARDTLGVSHILVDYQENLDKEASRPANDWDTPGRVAELQQLFASFNTTNKAYLSHVQDCKVWRMVTVPRLPTWRSASGSVLLLGDAAHAMLPHAAQGLSQGIESAVALATLLEDFGDTRGFKDVPSVTQRFEELRRPRVDKFVAHSAASVTGQTISDGPQQELRDARLRSTGQTQAAIDWVSVRMDMEAAPTSREFTKWVEQYDVVAEIRKAKEQKGYNDY
ncbi:hypothetical protein G7Y89_g8490 [Cudoniella acicularis]|uniref:Carrier domain-containing protein n=1 Tax=Cudoniella acicularis TaxID=354080 RepID=A0A8H4RI24_9HELO|nr:hypothetical protein G7Y89_g8490 [Cudoniella acicularis]